MSIGPRAIGQGQPTYVIAEAGVNHNGSVEVALTMVDAARQAGADAVKFQAFKATRLAGRSAPQAAYQKDSAAVPSQVEMLERLELKAGDFARIRRHCDSAGIEFLATPFGLEDLRVLVDLGIRAIKIASPDIINRPLLEAAVQTGLPILLSTGRERARRDRSVHGLLCRDHHCPLVLLHLREPLSHETGTGQPAAHCYAPRALRLPGRFQRSYGRDVHRGGGRSRRGERPGKAFYAGPRPVRPGPCLQPDPRAARRVHQAGAAGGGRLGQRLTRPR